ncbi:MAG: hypothetical protein ABFS56_21880 [Pseudomonadota bacterium]
MLVVSDTNIPSSLAACDALSCLFRLFPDTIIYIPPTVHQELQIGLEKGKTYLNLVLLATHQIQVLDLLELEQQMIKSLPNKLNRGECEAIALAKNRQALLLCNDKRAMEKIPQQNAHNFRVATMREVYFGQEIPQFAHGFQNCLVSSGLTNFAILAPIPIQKVMEKGQKKVKDKCPLKRVLVVYVSI